MALISLKDQNIQDTFQKVVQTDGTNLADGTGSLLPISFDENNVIALGGTAYINGSVDSGYNSVEITDEDLVSLVITGSVIPEGANNWSLGSETNFFKEVYVSEESIKFISSSGEVTPLKQKDVKDLKEGKPIKLQTAIDGTDRIIRAQAIYHETKNNHYIKQTTAGLWDYVGPGGSILTIDARTSHHTASLNSATSLLKIGGSISASGNLTVNNINGTINGGNF